MEHIHTSDLVYNITNAINDLRWRVIGLFKHYLPESPFELVLNDENGLLETVTIGQLGGISTSYSMSAFKGTYIRFPDGKNMMEMMNNPGEFQRFCQAFE